MKYHNQRHTALLTALVMGAMLLTTLTLPAAAGNLLPPHADFPSPTVTAIETENGKVTDSDGFIGNSLRGADARHHRRHRRRNVLDRRVQDRLHGAAQKARTTVDKAADGVRNAADRALTGAQEMTGRAGAALQEERSGEGTPESPSKGNTDRATDRADSAAATENAQTGNGVLGWVIAILVVLAITLVVLALLPKKNRHRS